MSEVQSGKQGTRDAQGRFQAGNQASVGLTHERKGGRPPSEVRAILREAGLEAIPRIRAIAADPKHKDHFKANSWLAERGLKDDLESRDQRSSQMLTLPQWGVTGNVA